MILNDILFEVHRPVAEYHLPHIHLTIIYLHQ